ncbi:HNH endonuclease signature motif containing protein [Arthrobacter pigmenti]
MTTQHRENGGDAMIAQRAAFDDVPASTAVTALADVPASVPVAMTVLGDTVTELLDTDPASVNDAGALEMLEQLARQRRRLEAVWLQVVAIADQLDATSAAGVPATLQQHLTGAAGMSPGRAKADVAAARALHGEPTRELIRTPKTHEGPLASMGELLANGDISGAHVDTGVKTLEQVPERLCTAENLATITGFLVNQAPNTTPKQIKTLAHRLIRNLEPDTDDHYDADAYLRRSFTMNTDITGMVHGTYQLDPAAGAELMAILNPVAAPHPGQKDEHGNTVVRDERTPAQRRADAFGELIHAAATYLGPVNHAPSPQPGGEGTGTDTRDPAPTRGQDTAGQQAPQLPDLFQLNPVNNPAAGKAAQPPAGQQPHGSKASQSTDSRSQEPPGNKAPGSRAGKLRLTRRQNRVSIVTTMDQIKTVKDRRTGRWRPIDPADSYCEQTGPITSGTLARMSCDALFERVVLDAKGALLDLGLPVRLASPAQKRALAVRDGGCTAPGCNRPPSWCQVHHVLWYSHDGPTDIANLDLKCDTHHSAVHAGLLEVAMIDGIPYNRVTAKGAKTYGTTAPIGTVAHPDHTNWIRNSYFDQLKAADHAARTITIPNTPTQQQWAA